MSQLHTVHRIGMASPLQRCAAYLKSIPSLCNPKHCIVVEYPDRLYVVFVDIARRSDMENIQAAVVSYGLIGGWLPGTDRRVRNAAAGRHSALDPAPMPELRGGGVPAAMTVSASGDGNQEPLVHSPASQPPCACGALITYTDAPEGSHAQKQPETMLCRSIDALQSTVPLPELPPEWTAVLQHSKHRLNGNAPLTTLLQRVARIGLPPHTTLEIVSKQQISGADAASNGAGDSEHNDTVVELLLLVPLVSEDHAFAPMPVYNPRDLQDDHNVSKLQFALARVPGVATGAITPALHLCYRLQSSVALHRGWHHMAQHQQLQPPQQQGVPARALLPRLMAAIATFLATDAR